MMRSVFGGIAGILLATPVFAQVLPADPGHTAPAATDDIVVTARRVSERLQSTPIAVTAVSADELRARSVTDISQLQQIAPSLHVTGGSSGGNGNAQFFIRGVGQADYLPTADPAVGVYVDGVYIARTTGNLFDLADVQQIEVLRGPQGTLFGKNTSGGAISVTTKRPTDDFGGTIEITGGNFGRIDGKANIQGPIVGGKLAGSLTVVSRNDNGYGTRLVDGKGAGNTNLLSGRAALNLHDAGIFSYYLTADYTRRREIPRPVHIEAVLPSTAQATYQRLVTRVTRPGDAYDSRYISANPLDTYAGAFTKSDLDVGGISGIGELDLGKASLKLITAYRKQKAITNVDNDGSPLPIADYYRTIRQDQFSQELQISGKTLADRLTYVGGLYYLRENATIAIRQDSFIGFYQAQRALGVSRAAATDLQIQANVRQTDDSYAGYGNLVFKITDKLGISGGLRYSYETKHIGETAFQVNRQYSLYRDPTALATPQAPGYFLSTSRDFHSLTPTAGLQYQATRDIFFYVSYAQGFKSGGFDGRPVAGLTSPSSFDPENVKSYEAGLKLELFNHALRFNLAGYHLNYQNLQVSSVVDRNGIATNLIQNAGDARINGLEVEALLRPAPGLELGVNASYTDAKLTRVASGATFQLGDHLTNTPRFLVNPSIQYGHAFLTGRLTGRVDGTYTSRVFYDLPNSYAVNAAGTSVTQNGPFLFPTVQNGYALLNARLSYAGGPWTVAVFATNITDKLYRTYGFSATSAGITEAYYAPPRQYGITVSRSFR